MDIFMPPEIDEDVMFRSLSLNEQYLRLRKKSLPDISMKIATQRRPSLEAERIKPLLQISTNVTQIKSPESPVVQVSTKGRFQVVKQKTAHSRPGRYTVKSRFEVVSPTEEEILRKPSYSSADTVY
jgi:hypothetical protein